jgi:hypothetical protein
MNPESWESLHTYLLPNPGRTGRSSVMSVAKCLGVDDIDAANMRETRAQWPCWREVEPVLAVVDHVIDLPLWMRRAEPVERDAQGRRVDQDPPTRHRGLRRGASAAFLP